MYVFDLFEVSFSSVIPIVSVSSVNMQVYGLLCFLPVEKLDTTMYAYEARLLGSKFMLMFDV